MPGLGSWYCRSESDPRWNASGENALVDGIFGAWEQIQFMRNCEEKYGKPPADFRYGAMKY